MRSLRLDPFSTFLAPLNLAMKASVSALQWLDEATMTSPASSRENTWGHARQNTALEAVRPRPRRHGRISPLAHLWLDGLERVVACGAPDRVALFLDGRAAALDALVHDRRRQRGAVDNARHRSAVLAEADVHLQTPRRRNRVTRERGEGKSHTERRAAHTDRELPVALDEFLGAVQWIDTPETGILICEGEGVGGLFRQDWYVWIELI